VLESDWFAWIQNAFLNEVGNLAEVDLLQYDAIIESTGSHTSLWESKLHLGLTSLEATVDSATSSGIPALMTSSSRLSLARSLSSTELLLTPPCTWVVPKRIRRDFHQRVIKRLGNTVPIPKATVVLNAVDIEFCLAILSFLCLREHPDSRKRSHKLK